MNQQDPLQGSLGRLANAIASLVVQTLDLPQLVSEIDVAGIVD